MKREFFSWLCLFSLCLVSWGCGERKAGGQSGTDSTGSFACVIDRSEPLALDARVQSVQLSANEVYDAVEGQHALACTYAHSLQLDIVRGTSARLLIGHGAGETTDAPSVSGPCEKLEVDVDATARVDGEGAEAHGPSIAFRLSRTGILDAVADGLDVSTVFHLDSATWISASVQLGDQNFRCETAGGTGGTGGIGGNGSVSTGGLGTGDAGN